MNDTILLVLAIGASISSVAISIGFAIWLPDWWRLSRGVFKCGVCLGVGSQRKYVPSGVGSYSGDMLNVKCETCEGTGLIVIDGK